MNTHLEHAQNVLRASITHDTPVVLTQRECQALLDAVAERDNTRAALAEWVMTARRRKKEKRSWILRTEGVWKMLREQRAERDALREEVETLRAALARLVAAVYFEGAYQKPTQALFRELHAAIHQAKSTLTGENYNTAPECAQPEEDATHERGGLNPLSADASMYGADAPRMG